MALVTFLRKVRVALTPRSYTLTARLQNGAAVYGKNRRGFGGRGVYIFRDGLEPELATLESFLDPSGILIDIGANTGVYSLKAAKYLSKGRGEVLSIEPNVDMAAMLSYSIQQNRFDNVRLRSFCAGERTASTTFWRNFERPHSFSLIKRDDAASSFSSLVVAVDDLVTWEGLPRVDYLKLDVEGAEQAVLAGARKTIERFRPIIQAEVTIRDMVVPLAGYLVFRAPGSPNKVFIPKESPKVAIAERLGWEAVSEG